MQYFSILCYLFHECTLNKNDVELIQCISECKYFTGPVLSLQTLIQGKEGQAEWKPIFRQYSMLQYFMSYGSRTLAQCIPELNLHSIHSFKMYSMDHKNMNQVPFTFVPALPDDSKAMMIVEAYLFGLSFPLPLDGCWLAKKLNMEEGNASSDLHKKIWLAWDINNGLQFETLETKACYEAFREGVTEEQKLSVPLETCTPFQYGSQNGSLLPLHEQIAPKLSTHSPKVCIPRVFYLLFFFSLYSPYSFLAGMACAGATTTCRCDGSRSIHKKREKSGARKKK